eukprot:1349102-Rhodomonas_salina.1
MITTSCVKWLTPSSRPPGLKRPDQRQTTDLAPLYIAIFAWPCLPPGRCQLGKLGPSGRLSGCAERQSLTCPTTTQQMRATYATLAPPVTLSVASLLTTGMTPGN